MADVHSSQVRSFNMSRIRDKNTKPEMIVRRFLFARGFRYRLHDNKLPGRPDIVLNKYKTIVFIHGCFWHGHEGCRFYVVPKTRTTWWLDKINRNQLRDKEVVEDLDSLGWRIITIWECELKKGAVDEALMRLELQLRRV